LARVSGEIANVVRFQTALHSNMMRGLLKQMPRLFSSTINAAIAARYWFL
jgi:hypothetical protein